MTGIEHEKSEEQKAAEAIGATITLHDLVGRHALTGLEHGVRTAGLSGSRWDDANTFAFILDGITYIAVEDPDDGYRSSMGTLEVGSPDLLNNTFDPIEVECRMNTTDYKDILEMVKVSTGHVIAEVGTDNTDDYYPSFVSNWNSELLGEL